MEGQKESNNGNKLKLLCLHGFRTSGKFLQKQISKWDPSIFAHFDMVCNSLLNNYFGWLVVMYYYRIQKGLKIKPQLQNISITKVQP